ncbi:MAG: hypothetical protein IPI65_04720 [Bacteroidetes bacterium]|nr:hypothetical protein [Bacteroidota bacterium]
MKSFTKIPLLSYCLGFMLLPIVLTGQTMFSGGIYLFNLYFNSEKDATI